MYRVFITNFLSKNESELRSSSSMLKFKFCCLEDIYSQKEWVGSGDLKVKKYH